MAFFCSEDIVFAKMNNFRNSANALGAMLWLRAGQLNS
jgi:hypothetical protein